MKSSIQVAIACAVIAGFASGCSQQQAAPVIASVPTIVPPAVAKPIPAPKPYPDKVVRPAPLKPAPLPKPVPVIKPKPAPRPTIVPKPVYVPPVKAKGNFRGTVQIDPRLRSQYQQ